MQTCGTAQHSNLRASCNDQMFPSLSTGDAFGNALKATEFPPKQLVSSDAFSKLHLFPSSSSSPTPHILSFAGLGLFLYG